MRFISGIPCSGTTLLVNLLGCHSQLSPIYETEFVLDWINVLETNQPTAQALWSVMDKWSSGLPQRPDSKKDYEKYPFGPHYILFDRKYALEQTRELLKRLEDGEDKYKAMGGTITSLLDKHAEISNNTYWINKTPLYIMALSYIHKMFPKMKVINCVRDGRDLAHTVLARPFGPNKVEDAAPWYISMINAAHKFRDKFPAQYLEIKYEDMIENTEETVSKCLEFWGMEDESKIIVGAYPYDIYSNRIGIYKTKPEVPGFSNGEGKRCLEQVGYGRE